MSCGQLLDCLWRIDPIVTVPHFGFHIEDDFRSYCVYDPLASLVLVSAETNNTHAAA